MTLHLLTANRLSDGAVVYLEPSGGWSHDIQRGLAVSSIKTAALEATGQLGVDNNVVVAPYLIEIEVSGGRHTPVRGRENIRANGPTVVGGSSLSSSMRKDASDVPV